MLPRSRLTGASPYLSRAEPVANVEQNRLQMVGEAVRLELISIFAKGQQNWSLQRWRGRALTSGRCKPSPVETLFLQSETNNTESLCDFDFSLPLDFCCCRSTECLLRTRSPRLHCPSLSTPSLTRSPATPQLETLLTLKQFSSLLAIFRTHCILSFASFGHA